jgi:tetratricopeptide (TPR) repeat protein
MVSFCGLAASSAFAASGSGGGSGGGGGGNGVPAQQVCNKGWVWSKAVQRCVKANSGSLDDKQLLEQGRALALSGYYDNALAVLDAVSNKNDAVVLTYIGYSHRKKGDTDVGIGYYKQALAIDPHNLNTREYLGEGYMSAGKVELAKAELAMIEQLCGNRECEQYQDLANALAGRPE